MPVIVMEIKTVNPHPNADTLVLCEVAAPGIEPLQVITKAEEHYALGDQVAIALVDSILKDGTKVKATKLRGCLSSGLALGQVGDPIGSDLSRVYCQPQVLTQAVFKAWPSIELLSNVRRSLGILGITPCITYRAKIKLDGTNAGVQIYPDGQVVAQSRTQVITPNNDNMGFAHWVTQHLDWLTALSFADPITLFGEWCGQGIQKRTAISQIDRKIFAVFAIQHGSQFIIDPEAITQWLPPHPDLFVLPYWGEPIGLNFGEPNQLQATIEQINQWVLTVEQTDPWVESTFGQAGLGEGLVFYPLNLEDQSLPVTFAELMFKAKGEHHQVVKTKKPVQISPEIAQGINEFVDLFVTPARLEQGVTEACHDQYEMHYMGAFLKWLVADVQKESVAELEASQLAWSDVSKAVMNAGRSWYKQQVDSH